MHNTLPVNHIWFKLQRTRSQNIKVCVKKRAWQAYLAFSNGHWSMNVDMSVNDNNGRVWFQKAAYRLEIFTPWALTKHSTFCRRHFLAHFLEWLLAILITFSVDYTLKCLTDYESTFSRVMTLVARQWPYVFNWNPIPEKEISKNGLYIEMGPDLY